MAPPMKSRYHLLTTDRPVVAFVETFGTIPCALEKKISRCVSCVFGLMDVYPLISELRTTLLVAGVLGAL